MKIPVTPPDVALLYSRLRPGSDLGLRLMIQSSLGVAPGGKYRHWDTLRHLDLEDGLTAEERWIAIKVARRQAYQELPLRDTKNRPFVFMLPSSAQEMLHRVDRDASGSIQAPEQVTNPESRDTYLVKSLIEEAVTSSQLEGASTTRQVAKEMLATGRKPRNRSEQMIANNYSAMQFVRAIKAEPLTPSIVLELHRLLTVDAIDEPDAAGRFRRPDEDIRVSDEYGAILHTPPEAGSLEKRMKLMCEFANARSSEPFIHPVIRAITLHFWLAYDHPFVDGNGRTARALFYWSMARQGYWLCEYISISRILKKARSKYARAFLYTETDENDLTYFLLHQLEVLVRAIDDLHEYLVRKSAEIRETGELLSTAARMRLNYRQLALLNHALKNVNAVYTVESHRRLHGVSYETSRSDLLELVSLGTLDQGKRGRALSFSPVKNLRGRLATAGAKGTKR